MLAPITHHIPPPGYGPWEQVVSDLTDGLVRRGHDVSLLAPAGSRTSARLEATVPYPLADWPPSEDQPDHRVWEEIHVASMAELVAGDGFDIVHSHLGVHPLGYAPFLPAPMVTTLHGSAWNGATHPALKRHAHLPFVSLSDSERAFFPDLNYVATVHNGIDSGRFRFGGEAGGFLLFAGRLAPEKQPHVAIEVARRADLPLKLVGPVEARYRDYFSVEVEPGIDGINVEYLGDMLREELIEMYPLAAALVMPLAWDEPFGLVVVESLASGTPVIGWRRGSLPELIRPGVTGALVNDIDEAVSAVLALHRLDRRECRIDAETRFDLMTMTDGYLAAYRRVLEA